MLKTLYNMATRSWRIDHQAGIAEKAKKVAIDITFALRHSYVTRLDYLLGKLHSGVHPEETLTRLIELNEYYRDILSSINERNADNNRFALEEAKVRLLLDTLLRIRDGAPGNEEGNIDTERKRLLSRVEDEGLLCEQGRFLILLTHGKVLRITDDPAIITRIAHISEEEGADNIMSFVAYPHQLNSTEEATLWMPPHFTGESNGNVISLDAWVQQQGEM